MTTLTDITQTKIKHIDIVASHDCMKLRSRSLIKPKTIQSALRLSDAMSQFNFAAIVTCSTSINLSWAHAKFVSVDSITAYTLQAPSMGFMGGIVLIWHDTQPYRNTNMVN